MIHWINGESGDQGWFQNLCKNYSENFSKIYLRGI